jgi:hypothetical protein
MATNSTYASARQYKEDVSDVIRGKISLFESQGNRISALELELNDLREQHSRLEQELEPYRLQYRTMHQVSAFSNALNDPCLIHHLPDELLYSIFKICIQGPDNRHRRTIGTLLFVCKRWYTLTMGSPKLWSNIQIYDTYKLFDFVNRRSRISYVDSCLSRSEGLPLDVQLDFSSVCEMDYIKEELVERAETIMHKDGHDGVWEQIYGQDWPFSSPRFYEELERFLDHLFGDEGQHLKRYKTLSIDLPDDDIVMNIVCSRMTQKVSNLTSLEVESRIDWSLDDQLPQVLDLPKVKDLTIRSNYAEPLSVSHLGLSSTVLEQIKTDVGESLLNLKELSSFTYLRSLELTCPTYLSPRYKEVAAPLFSVQLPSLDSFGLVRRFKNLRKIHFDFPSLRVLSLAPDDGSQRLPILSSTPSNVEWHLKLNFIDKIKQDPSVLIHLLEDMRPLSKTIQRMSFPWLIKDTALELVELYQKRGDLPSLSHIMLERTGYPPQVIEVGGLS